MRGNLVIDSKFIFLGAKPIYSSFSAQSAKSICYALTSQRVFFLPHAIQHTHSHCELLNFIAFNSENILIVDAFRIRAAAAAVYEFQFSGFGA